MIFLKLGHFPNADKLSTAGTGYMSIMTWHIYCKKTLVDKMTC